MSLLGFDAVGRLALGQIPFAKATAWTRIPALFGLWADIPPPPQKSLFSIQIFSRRPVFDTSAEWDDATSPEGSWTNMVSISTGWNGLASAGGTWAIE